MSIETLNQWAGNGLGFAWPMFWQSSLLIAVLFAADILLARAVRAAVRHGLWLVVLVKLLLPPALALPTGVAWWLWPAKPPPVPLSNDTVVTYGETGHSADLPPPSIPAAPPPPRLSGAGMVFLASTMISLGLLAWLLCRWLRMVQKIRGSPASEDLSGILEEARRLARLRRCPRLKLMEGMESPAVFGLFRPVILLPRGLMAKLSREQLRAVLLHEMIHLRRRDIWVHFGQVLLQIAYWWHPMLWVANARIRRVREEAVDDAVMLALREDAEDYAPTLLEVAKFAFRRPLAGVAVIGILESRSALRTRIERLTNFHPPRRAGLTLFSLFGIFAFSTVALPMGRPPAPQQYPSPAPHISQSTNDAANQAMEVIGQTMGTAPAVISSVREPAARIAGPGPMIHIKAWFMEAPKTFFSSETLPSSMTNGVGILTPTEMQSLRLQLESRPDVAELAEPEVTTISGLETRMRSTIIQPVITNYIFDPSSAEPIVPQIAKVETGPVFDVVPKILADGHTLDMRMTAADIQFLGYAPSGRLELFATNSAGNKIKLPVVRPRFQVSQGSFHRLVPSGQTLILFPKPEQNLGDKAIVVLVTTTLIDPAGHPISHSSLTAGQAGAFAVQLANEKASQSYGIMPFRKGGSAQFKHGRWVWHRLEGYGHGDVQATVLLAANGSTNSTSVQILYDQILSP